MGHKKRKNFRINQENNYTPTPPPKKRGFSTGKKVLVGVALVAIIVIAVSVALSQSAPPSQQSTETGGQAYPQNVAPVTYSTATLTDNDAKVSVPVSSVNSSKLVFVDLKLQTPTQVLNYNGRQVPLSYYRNGEYLPLVLISTPSGNTVAGIRTCEPCGSFSFHIVKGTNLKCDICGAEWKLEDFSPASGGCGSYPPPKLSATVSGDNVAVDLSPLKLQFA